MVASNNYSPNYQHEVGGESLWLSDSSCQSLNARLESLTRKLDAGQTERWRTQDRSRHPFERLSQILNALPGAVLLLDVDGVIRAANSNAHHILGQPLLGLTWSNVVNRVFSSLATADGDLHLKSGGWMHLSRQSIDGGVGELLLLADVSNSRQMVELLQRQERLSSIGP